MPKKGDIKADRDYRLMIGDTDLGFTFNGRSFPFTSRARAEVGETVRLRVVNTGDQVHAFHLHGVPFTVVAQDGIPRRQPEGMDTLTISPGRPSTSSSSERYPGKWVLHCHMFVHSHMTDDVHPAGESGMNGLTTLVNITEAGRERRRRRSAGDVTVPPPTRFGPSAISDASPAPASPGRPGVVGWPPSRLRGRTPPALRLSVPRPRRAERNPAMMSSALRFVRPGRRRVVLAAVLAISVLLVAFPPAGLRSTSGLGASDHVPSIPSPDIPIPDLPSTADVQSLLDMLPAGVLTTSTDLDLTKADDIKRSSPPSRSACSTRRSTSPTNRAVVRLGPELFGGKSLAVIEMLPGVKTSVKFIVGPETGTDTGHTATSLIRPAGAANIDQAGGFIGTKDVRDHRAGPVRVRLQDAPVHARRRRRRRPAHARAWTSATKSIIKMPRTWSCRRYSDIIFQLVQKFFVITMTRTTGSATATPRTRPGIRCSRRPRS